MSDAPEYTFKITDFTPATMPFGRLLEYYAELKKMLGDPENFHLIEIAESSHASKFAINPSCQRKVSERLAKLKDGSAPKPARRAQDTINEMLREDRTSGVFSDRPESSVIDFPGGKPDAAAVYRVRDAAAFTGELYHIAGTPNDAKVRISTEAYGVVFCTTTKETAKGLRDFLFETVRVSGRGMWTRPADGPWKIDDFAITDYAPVTAESLRSAVDRIRAVDVDWPDDPIGEIRRANG